MVERIIEVWQRIEVFKFPTETSWKKELHRMKRQIQDKSNFKIKGVKIKTPERDELLTGIEKQVFHNQEKPKLSREERLRNFKNKKTKNG